MLTLWRLIWQKQPHFLKKYVSLEPGIQLLDLSAHRGAHKNIFKDVFKSKTQKKQLYAHQ